MINTTKKILIVADAHFEWIECYPMSSTHSDAVIMKLYELLIRFCLDYTLVIGNVILLRVSLITFV